MKTSHQSPKTGLLQHSRTMISGSLHSQTTGASQHDWHLKRMTSFKRQRTSSYMNLFRVPSTQLQSESVKEHQFETPKCLGSLAKPPSEQLIDPCFSTLAAIIGQDGLETTSSEEGRPPLKFLALPRASKRTNSKLAYCIPILSGLPLVEPNSSN